MRFDLSVLALLLAVSSPQINAQQPTVQNARLSTTPVSHGLSGELSLLERASTPLWIGYSISVNPGFHFRNGSGDDVSFLESSNSRENYYSDARDVALDHVNILMRVSDGKIEKLRLEEPGRTLDAGGLPFIWLTEVSPNDSAGVFDTLARSESSKHLRDEAVFYISLHRAPTGVLVLESMVSANNGLDLREKAAFWLASQSTRPSFLVIQRLAREDNDPRFREKLTFDLTLVHEPEALDTLIGMAQHDASAQVRHQAQFWMATLGGNKVAANLRESVQKDPDEEVRQAAVFGLSRLPGEEATKQLIQVANTSSDPAIRKQAVFWLGQSRDPKAMDFLVQLLETPNKN